MKIGTALDERRPPPSKVRRVRNPFCETAGSDRASSIIAFNFGLRAVRGDGALIFKCLPVARKRPAKSIAAAVVASPGVIRALASSSNCVIDFIDFFTSSG
jgi:hypothetical protein